MTVARRLVLLGVVALAVAALLVANLVEGGSDAKSKACTAGVNEVNARDIANGYPAHSRSESQRRYDNCMDNPLRQRPGTPNRDDEGLTT